MNSAMQPTLHQRLLRPLRNIQCCKYKKHAWYFSVTYSRISCFDKPQQIFFLFIGNKLHCSFFFLFSKITFHAGALHKQVKNTSTAFTLDTIFGFSDTYFHQLETVHNSHIVIGSNFLEVTIMLLSL